MKLPTRNFTASLAVAAFCAAGSLQAQTLIYGLTSTNSLVTFDSAPGIVSPARPLTGLGAGETVVGLDFRPFDGRLYALSRDGADSGRLYTVNLASGALAPIALSGPALTVTGSADIDFNPAALGGTNALRILTGAGQNYRLVFNGDAATVNVDGAVNVGGGGAADTNVVATAYSNNRAGLPGGAGAGGTAQYALDAALDLLYRVNPPNNGTLTNALPLGIDIGAVGGLDIVTGSDRALAVLTAGGSNALYDVNLTTGAATALRGLPMEIVDLAVPVPAKITSISSVETNAVVNWAGGVGPFLVQRGNVVDEAFCGIMTTTNRSATLVREGRTGFFRVADLAGAPPTRFTVSLSGASERPNPVNTTADGFGTLEVSGDTLTFDISYRGLSGAATMAHIHGPGSSSQAVGVLVDLGPFAVGGLAASGSIQGSVALTPAVKAALLGGRTYVNIHTGANGGGEVRGQVTPMVFQTSLSGEGERPNPVDTAARGFGTFTVVGKELAFNIHYTGLSGPAQMAHIHGAAPTFGTAGVLVDLAPFAVGGFGSSGAIVGKVALTQDQLNAVVDGLTYVNIHTVANGGGEVRGQILPELTATAFSAALTGAAERPNPVTTPGYGFASASLLGDSLQLRIYYRNLSSTLQLAHIHGPAAASGAAGVLVDLFPLHQGTPGTNGWFSGTIALSAAQKSALLSGLAYVNLHTVNNGGGEVRGQLVPVVLQSTLNGASERPNPVVTDGTGYARLALLGKQLSFGLNYRALGSAAQMAHIHGPAGPEGFAGVLVDLAPFSAPFGTSGIILGSTELSDSQLAAVVDGLTYFNIHTVNNGGGEVRGQIVP